VAYIYIYIHVLIHSKFSASLTIKTVTQNADTLDQHIRKALVASTNESEHDKTRLHFIRAT